jgi:hypothetical protein
MMKMICCWTSLALHLFLLLVSNVLAVIRQGLKPIISPVFIGTTEVVP